MVIDAQVQHADSWAKLHFTIGTVNLHCLNITVYQIVI
jgi:hypothetical protein